MEHEMESTELYSEDFTKNLKGAAFWARIIGILSMIGFAGLGLFGLLLLFGVDVFNRWLSLPSDSVGYAELNGMWRGVGMFYLLMSLFWIWIGWLIYQFGSLTKAGLIHQSASDLSKAIQKLKIYFTAHGVMLLLALGLFLFLLLFIFLAGYFSPFSTNTSTFG
jgi:hypothetical protein